MKNFYYFLGGAGFNLLRSKFVAYSEWAEPNFSNDGLGIRLVRKR